MSEGPRSSIRPLSVSEVSTALDCMARWDFTYGGHLAGTALKPKQTAPVLSGGKAWGRAMAAWHGGDALGVANEAMLEALDEDAERQREFGVYSAEEDRELRERLSAILAHYTSSSEQTLVEEAERRFWVPIPARDSNRPSSRFRLLAFADGTTSPSPEERWLVEFKLRGRLSDARLVALSRQLRWYAWGYEQETGLPITGALTIERLNEAPKPPRMVKTGKKDGSLRPSHAKDQLCTPAAYRRACHEHGVEPDPETVEELAARRWQQRIPIRFLAGELEEAGRDLTGAARLIAQLDRGEIPPLRNAKPQNCNGCRFRDICAHPDPELVDALFERVPPKRDRDPEEAAAA